MTHLGSLIGLRIDGGDIEANVALFDMIYEQKTEIENETGLEFVLETIDDIKKAINKLQ